MLINTKLLINHFKKTCRDYSIEYVMASPLLHPDLTLLFVNASVTPYKSQMINGELINPTCSIQPCFRFRKSREYMYHFNMLGLMGNFEYYQQLTHALLAFLDSIGLTSDRLGIVYKKDHYTELKPILNLLKALKTTVLITDSEKYATDWKFGNNNISGIGLTICLFSNNHDKDLNSKYSIPLGNIIIITNSCNKKYIDIGFGLETILSTQYHNSLYNIPEHQTCMNLIEKYDLDVQKEIAKNLYAISFLLKHNVNISNKGQGYIIKKCYYDLFKCLISNTSLNENDFFNLALIILLNEISESHKSTIEKTIGIFLKNQNSNYKKIKKELKKTSFSWDKTKKEKGIDEVYFKKLEKFYE